MKKKINIHIVIILALSLVFMASCQRVVVKLDSIPKNTPESQAIYVTGNFNNWDPADEKYILILDSDSNYYVSLPPGLGTVEYKFTRGDWTSGEKGICGEEIGNRILILGELDTISNTVESWNDLDPLNCPKLTIKLENVPENTPIDDIIALASNLNSWDPDDASVFEKDTFGDFYVTIDRPKGVEKLDYKLTRGDLTTAESDEYGNDLPNRTVEFGKKDTVIVNVEGWTDLPETKSQRVVFIIRNIPKNTPKSDKLYFVSNLNSWDPWDQNYEFQTNKNGKLFYSFPRKKLILDYKITRGGWNTVEVDKNGSDISNRSIDLQFADTIYLDIQRWKDMRISGDEEITVVLEQIPESTPNKSKLYISGSFNGWNPGRLRHMFDKNANGMYYVNLPRKDGMIEFRITRGSWESSQIDKYGSDMPAYHYHYNDFDTLFIDVKNWKDKPINRAKDVTLVLNKMPDNTPTNAVFFLAPDFNNWNPEDIDLIFDELDDGRPVITFPVKGNNMKFKITRGGWQTVEVDIDGMDLPDRELFFGFADTVYINIVKWRDFDGSY